MGDTDFKARTLTIPFFPSFNGSAHTCNLLEFKAYYQFMLQRVCVMVLKIILSQRTAFFPLIAQDNMSDK